MHTNALREQANYLVRCSQFDAKAYRLSRLSEAANLKRQAIEALRRAIAAEAEALLAAFIDEYGEEMICGGSVSRIFGSRKLREPAALPPRRASETAR